MVRTGRAAAVIWRRPWLRGLALLSPPVAAFLFVYLAALAALFVSAFWSVDPFASEVVRTWGLDNFRQILESDVYRRIAFRTVGIAAAVTVTDAVLAFPF